MSPRGSSATPRQMRPLAALLLMLLPPLMANALRLPSPTRIALRAPPPAALARETGSGKGFGKKPAAAGKASTPAPAEGSTLASAADSEPSGAVLRGQEALRIMREEAGVDPAAKRAAERRALLTEEELMPVDPSAGVMPEEVSNRMLRRVVPFAGLPVFGGIALFCAFYYANKQLDMDLPPSIVAYSTQALLLLSFAGITWGVMSTSWDEGEEGSLLGLEQVGKNSKMMKDGIRRGQASAVNEAQEQDAEDAGILMSKKAQNRAERRKKSK